MDPLDGHEIDCFMAITQIQAPSLAYVCLLESSYFVWRIMSGRVTLLPQYYKIRHLVGLITCNLLGRSPLNSKFIQNNVPWDS